MYLECLERNVERFCRQTDQADSEAEALVRQSPLMEAWEAEEPPLLYL
jgi:hypothetical protein